MKTVTDPKEWQTLRATLKGRIGFVPTMGHLHEGHISLCARARQECDIVVASIFVNPTQFNQQSDYDQYKRTFDDDCALLKKSGVDYVFYPDAKDMYHDNYEVVVSETILSKELEGEFRPGHFNGMMTVVLKLLNIVQPWRAYFGEKDFQQLMLVRKMVAALFLPVEIIACPTLRASSGLALSSRNGRLTPEQQQKAALLYRYISGPLPDDQVRAVLEREGFKVEYVVTRWGRRLVAAWLEGVRLIDNVPVEETKEGVCHAINA